MDRNSDNLELSDSDLIELFNHDGATAWRIFCQRYSDFIYTLLRRAGFDYDQSMDRFVYIFEKLRDGDFRRLRSIRYAGTHGDITPWIRLVVKNLCVNWAWSEDGRRRIYSFVADLSTRDQRIFQLYFWGGNSPWEIFEILRLEHDKSVEAGDVFDGLERIFEHLTEKKCWRLLSNLSRMRRTLSLDFHDDEGNLFVDVVDPSAVDALADLEKKERNSELRSAIEALSPRERLMIAFRYEEGLTFREISAFLSIDEREATNLHKSVIYKLRKKIAG